VDTKRLVINALAVIGGIALLGAAAAGTFIWFIDGSGDTNEVKGEFVSSDGSFRAIHAVSMGGGAAGWCRQFIVVRPSNARKAVLPYRDACEELVFDANCSTKVSASWTGASVLTIRYQITRDSGMTSVSMRTRDQTGRVAVRYEIEA
jgi:hypothetical protein